MVRRTNVMLVVMVFAMMQVSIHAAFIIESSGCANAGSTSVARIITDLENFLSFSPHLFDIH
jgi:hypothetical protein